MAIGRTPNTQDIGLDKIGLKPGVWLTVDDTLRVVGEDGEPVGDGLLYAAGDINRRVLLTQPIPQHRIAHPENRRSTP